MPCNSQTMNEVPLNKEETLPELENKTDLVSIKCKSHVTTLKSKTIFVKVSFSLKVTVSHFSDNSMATLSLCCPGLRLVQS